MTVLAFAVLTVMLGAYVLLDGYDLGVGAIHLFVARDDSERAATMASIGPFWNGNEVWLIAAGGTLFALFPQVYASSFSGFYLPFMVLLWLLMFRGIALELRSHFPSDLWRGFFDVTFAIASALLILLLGVALGNVLHGVPLDAAHYFVGTFAYLLNPYAVGVGVLAVVALAQHGAAWVVMKVDGPPADRSMTALRVLSPFVLVLAGVMTLATFQVRSPWPNLLAVPWIAIAPIGSILGLVGVLFFVVQGRRRSIFGASTVFLAGMLASAAVTLFPYLLPGYPSPQNGLSVDRYPPSPAALATILTVVILGLVIVAVYRTYAVRSLAGNAPAANRAP
ncbi:MAG: cytochrome d ubiquinol oxidase subunit II [Candidatus Eremiobacteraeota bacterium]|nr:cytochrome d ubiquinol oxidase subunit II [Candidatus Eremiobacteraeota bacterium]MBC5803189.1 cytochrome d ubiquinol oxidase subunit II [Candidatus Eremiobacteraeota bacterium]MBC5825606.1 cytochrome d ubiquinol oxidase subunit II [Candidatus Eremiobacteraeota bacterium]